MSEVAWQRDPEFIGAKRAERACVGDYELLVFDVPADLAGLRIDHLHRRAGIVGLHHRTRRVAVAESGVRPAPIGVKLLAEPGVTIAVGMSRPVFLPKQRQRHALALEFLRHPWPLRLAQVLRRSPDRPEQGPL